MVVKNLLAALQEEESVYVNDVGLFRKVFHPAKMKKGQMTPPHYTLELDSKADGSGFAFVMRISQNESMRIVDSDSAVKQWVASIKENIRQNKSALVEPLGTFSMRKGELILKSADIADFNEEFEGMMPIAISPVDEPEPAAEPQSEPMPSAEQTPEPEIAATSEAVAESVSEPETDAGLEVQYNAEEDAYRITHWGYNVDFTFTWNKETNECHVPSQFTGYTHSSYGEVYVAEANDLNPKWGVPSSSYDPETRTFSFGVAYYVSAGVFGAGVETFTLTPAQARRLGLDKKSLKVSSSLNSNLRKSHARNKAVISRDELVD